MQSGPNRQSLFSVHARNLAKTHRARLRFVSFACVGTICSQSENGLAIDESASSARRYGGVSWCSERLNDQWREFLLEVDRESNDARITAIQLHA